MLTAFNAVLSILYSSVKGGMHVFCFTQWPQVLYQDLDEVKGKKIIVDIKAIKVKFILRVNKINIKNLSVSGHI